MRPTPSVSPVPAVEGLPRHSTSSPMSWWATLGKPSPRKAASQRALLAPPLSHQPRPPLHLLDCVPSPVGPATLAAPRCSSPAPKAGAPTRAHAVASALAQRWRRPGCPFRRGSQSCPTSSATMPQRSPWPADLRGQASSCLLSARQRSPRERPVSGSPPQQPTRDADVDALAGALRTSRAELAP